jgi:hypothetical protein
MTLYPSASFAISYELSGCVLEGVGLEPAAQARENTSILCLRCWLRSTFTEGTGRYLAGIVFAPQTQAHCAAIRSACYRTAIGLSWLNPQKRYSR